MYCPKCKSEHITELMPTIIHNTVRFNGAVHAWSPKDQDLIQNFPAFNFQCEDCGTKFCVDDK